MVKSVFNELLDTKAKMWQNIAETMSHDTWDSDTLMNRWIEIWENIVFCMKANDYLTQDEFIQLRDKALVIELELCRFFDRYDYLYRIEVSKK